MRPSSTHDDWPAPADPVGLAVILPGRNYPATMPLLTFAGRVALQHGWQVRTVGWHAPDLDWTETIAWVADQLRDAVGDHEGRVLVIGKSLGSCAAPYAAEMGYDAVWLTPLLKLPALAAGMADSPARQLLVGGTDDEAWDGAVAEPLRTRGCDVLGIPGADHGMFIAEDAVRTAEVHVDVTRAIDAFLKGAPE